MKKKIVSLLFLGTVLLGWRAFAQDCPCPCPAASDANNGGGDVNNGGGGEGVGGDQGTADPAANFQQQLSPYGRWVDREGYGRVWIPTVAAGWRPYTTGRWVYTDQGWAWMADESWGWAAFHYGRWFYDDSYSGWAWVPGSVWAPAWVAWRSGGGYVGWAPLTPAIGFTAGIGLNFGGVSLDVAIAPSHFCFVSEGAILSTSLATVIVPSSRNVTIIHNTTNITNYSVVNNRIVNNGVNVQHIEQVTGRPVPRLQVAATAQAGSGLARVHSNQVSFYQPPAIAKAARQVKAESFVNRGGSAQPRSATTTGAASGRRTTGATGAVAQPKSQATTGLGRTTGASGRRGRSTGTTGTSTTGLGTTGSSGRRGHSTGTSGATTGAAPQLSTGSSQPTHHRAATGGHTTTGTAGSSSTGTGGHYTTGSSGRHTTGTSGSSTTGTGGHNTTGTSGHYTTGTGHQGSAPSHPAPKPPPPKPPPPPHHDNKPPL
jgi:hypothetical protein